jgi:hypothetical protein
LANDLSEIVLPMPADYATTACRACTLTLHGCTNNEKLLCVDYQLGRAISII